MALKPAIEHGVANKLLENTEKGYGVIETYRLTLREDLPFAGWAPYPEGEILAQKVVQDGVEKFMFTNPMDDYVRNSIIELSDAVNPVFVKSDTPYAHAQAILEDKARTVEAEKIAAIAKAEADARIRLQLVNIFGAHLGLPRVESYGRHFEFISDRLLKIEAHQGGKLDVSSVAPLRAYGDIPDMERGLSYKFDQPYTHPDVGLNLTKLEYVARFKHDLVFAVNAEENRVDVQVLNAKGAVVSEAKLPLCLGEERSGVNVDDEGDEFEYAFIPEFISTKAHDDEDFKPTFFENGRPVSVETSKFAPLYEALSVADFVPSGMESCVKGMAFCKDDKGLNGRLERNMRSEMSRNGVGAKIAEFLTPKRERDLGNSVGLTA